MISINVMETEITLTSIFSKKQSRLVGVSNAAEAGGAGNVPANPASTGMSFSIVQPRR